MTLVMAYAIPLAMAAGAAFPILLLRSAPRSGRGWCRKCQTPDLWIILGLLIGAELLLAQRSRLARRRMIRCRMCESEAEPQDLRRARAGQG